jgi:NADPH:quinone reductase-like Zn-dependent oxidoreductase
LRLHRLEDGTPAHGQATLGSDPAGVVTEVGGGVTRFKPGDAVFANIFDQGTGSIAEFAVVPERAAVVVRMQ